jgi:hypothetical protein
MIPKTFTRKKGGKVFVIMGMVGLAGASALRVGLRGRKRNRRRALGLPPETAAAPGTHAQNAHLTG